MNTNDLLLADLAKKAEAGSTKKGKKEMKKVRRTVFTQKKGNRLERRLGGQGIKF